MKTKQERRAVYEQRKARIQADNAARWGAFRADRDARRAAREISDRPATAGFDVTRWAVEFHRSYRRNLLWPLTLAAAAIIALGLWVYLAA